MATKRAVEGKAHAFGGDWTTAKLAALESYLRAYGRALKDKPFRKAYIDAFAGTGYRSMRSDDPQGQALLFPDLAEAEAQQLLDGSARVALKSEPSFDKYIFIEQDAARCSQLRQLGDEFPSLASRIDVRQDDANRAIQALCRPSVDWSGRRAVMFLDPYGMQVEWKTIEAIARTHAIDLWLLFPLGIGVSRLLPRSGKMPDAWRARLDTLLGTTDWYDAFYRVERTPSLFGDTDEELVVRATNEVISQYFVRRLESVFPGVATPGILRNSTGCPLFLFCFASGNVKGSDIAKRIADHILKDLR